MAHPDATRLEDFIAVCGEVSETGPLWDGAQAFFEAFGAERSVYVHLPPIGARDNDGPEVFAQLCEPGWSDLYRARQYYRRDPVLERALCRGNPMVWSEIRRLTGGNAAQRAVLGFYRDTGFGSGVTVPVFGPGGRNGSVTLGFGDQGEAISDRIGADETARARLQAACEAAHLRHCALRLAQKAQPPKLSERERELLTWVARGKSNGVIADIMEISPHTVDAYLRRVFLKLDATDRISATLRALAEGLVVGH